VGDDVTAGTQGGRDGAEAAVLRLDRWLWFARFFKSRSQAQAAIAAGTIWLNGRRVERPAQAVRVGDELVLPVGRGWRGVVIQALAARRGPAAEARRLYRDLTRQAPSSAEG